MIYITQGQELYSFKKNEWKQLLTNIAETGDNDLSKVKEPLGVINTTAKELTRKTVGQIIANQEIEQVKRKKLAKYKKMEAKLAELGKDLGLND